MDIIVFEKFIVDLNNKQFGLPYLLFLFKIYNNDVEYLKFIIQREIEILDNDIECNDNDGHGLLHYIYILPNFEIRNYYAEQVINKIKNIEFDYLLTDLLYCDDDSFFDKLSFLKILFEYDFFPSTQQLTLYFEKIYINKLKFINSINILEKYNKEIIDNALINQFCHSLMFGQVDLIEYLLERYRIQLLDIYVDAFIHLNVYKLNDELKFKNILSLLHSSGFDINKTTDICFLFELVRKTHSCCHIEFVIKELKANCKIIVGENNLLTHYFRSSNKLCEHCIRLFINEGVDIYYKSKNLNCLDILRQRRQQMSSMIPIEIIDLFLDYPKLINNDNIGLMIINNKYFELFSKKSCSYLLFDYDRYLTERFVKDNLNNILNLIDTREKAQLIYLRLVHDKKRILLFTDHICKYNFFIKFVKKNTYNLSHEYLESKVIKNLSIKKITIQQKKLKWRFGSYGYTICKIKNDLDNGINVYDNINKTSNELKSISLIDYLGAKDEDDFNKKVNDFIGFQ